MQATKLVTSARSCALATLKPAAAPARPAPANRPPNGLPHLAIAAANFGLPANAPPPKKPRPRAPVAPKRPLAPRRPVAPKRPVAPDAPLAPKRPRPPPNVPAGSVTPYFFRQAASAVRRAAPAAPVAPPGSPPVGPEEPVALTLAAAVVDDGDELPPQALSARAIAITVARAARPRIRLGFIDCSFVLSAEQAGRAAAG